MSDPISIFGGLLPADDLAILTAALAKKPPQTPVIINDPVVSEVTVAIADPAAITTPGTELETVTALNADSESIYGKNSQQVVTLLATSNDAARLARYLIRPAPVYWFSTIEVFLNPLTPADRDLVAELDVGAQVTVSKRFPAIVNPVEQTLFVEGVEHVIGRDGHTVTFYTSPGQFYEPFELGLSTLGDPAYGLG